MRTARSCSAAVLVVFCSGQRHRRCVAARRPLARAVAWLVARAATKPARPITSRSRPQERRMRFLPHQHRRAHHARHRHRAPGLHGLPRRRRDRDPAIRHPSWRSGIRTSEKSRASAAHRFRARWRLRESSAPLHRMAEGELRLRALRQSRRFARRAGNLRQQPVATPRKCGKFQPA